MTNTTQLLIDAAKDSEFRELLMAAVTDAVAETLGYGAYDCIRVWSAWSYGTMSADDFLSIADQPERLEEIAGAAVDAFFRAAAQSQEKG